MDPLEPPIPSTIFLLIDRFILPLATCPLGYRLGSAPVKVILIRKYSLPLFRNNPVSYGASGRTFSMISDVNRKGSIH